ncbi:MAG: glycosyltransferase family 39 protein [Bacteroidia bacterium]|nr:glycosyltransferase family 39 protein [Bacteroidia bacterium]
MEKVIRNNVPFVLFATVWLTYAMFFTPAGGVTPNRYMNTTHSLVNEGSFTIDKYHENTCDKAYYEGHYYAGALPGPSIFAVPSYVLFKLMYAMLPDAIKANFGEIQSYKKTKLEDSSFYGSVDNVEYFLSQGFVVIFTVGVAGALLVLFIYKISLLVTSSAFTSYMVAIAFAFATHIMWHAVVLFEQVFSMLFTAMAVYYLLRAEHDELTKWHVVALGLVTAMTFTVEVSGLLVAAGVTIYVVMFKRQFTVLYFAGFAIPVIALALHNVVLFDHPFKTGYHFLAGESYQNIVSEGMIGLSYPRAERFIGLLLSPERGLLLFAPISMLAIVSFGHAIVDKQKRDRMLVFSGVMFLSALCYVASFKGWNAGGAFGPRYLLFAMPFLVIPVSVMLRERGKGTFYFLMIFGMLINIAGAMRGFTETYYTHVLEFVNSGFTLPWLGQIQSHTVNPHGTISKLFSVLQSVAIILLSLLGAFSLYVGWTLRRKEMQKEHVENPELVSTGLNS